MSVSLTTVRFLAWIASRPRSSSPTADAWIPSAEREVTYEAAVADGLVEVDGDRVVLTAAGAALLTESIWRAACPVGRERRAPEPRATD